MFEFNVPARLSISKLRSKHSLDRLRNPQEVFDKANLFLTGRTGSGKTTLTNLFLGDDGYFTSTGMQDCTDEVNFVDLGIGLRIFDLPGVCSDDFLENYNRSALGVKQLDDLPIVNSLTISRHALNDEPKREECRSSVFRDRYRPDFILYLIAPDKQFLRPDKLYLKDLLESHTNIIFLLNIFSGLRSAYKVDDTLKRIVSVYQTVFGCTAQPCIHEINCSTGEGVDRLFSVISSEIKESHKKLFDYVLNYQSSKISDEYILHVQSEILKFCSYSACQKPERIELDGDEKLFSGGMQDICFYLWRYLDDLPVNISSSTGKLPAFYIKFIESVVSSLCEGFTEEHYEDEYKEVSIPIYKPKPIFKKIYEEEIDYDNPIYETRTGYKEPDDLFEGIENFFQHDRWRTRYTYKTITGYHKKTVARKVCDGYVDELSHYETSIEKTNKKIKVGESYKEFSIYGIATILAIVYTKLLLPPGKISTESEFFSKYEVHFAHMLDVCEDLEITNITEREAVEIALRKNLDVVFDHDVKQVLCKFSR